MAETRAAILRAARPIMLRDGLGGTTLDRVAAEGGIAKMTLYRHFPSKEALFEGLVTATCESMREGLENAPTADTDKPIANRLADELSAFTSALIEPDGLALYRLIVADGWRFPELSRVFDRSGMRVIRRRIAERRLPIGLGQQHKGRPNPVRGCKAGPGCRHGYKRLLLLGLESAIQECEP